MINLHRVKKIEVKKLFGYYNYNLSFNELQYEKMIILYGDNGCGKTTVLNILFHLLSPERNAGHKTAIAKIPFERFYVELSNNIKIDITRENQKRLTAGYTISILNKNKKLAHISFVIDVRDKLVTTEGQEEQEEKFWYTLQDINLGCYYLSDNRQIQLGGISNDHSEFIMHQRIIRRQRDFFMHEDDNDNKPELVFKKLLAGSIKRAESWLVSNFMRASSQGESNVNTLYEEILKSLASSCYSSNATEEDRNNTITKIASLQGQCERFAQYGLLPKFHAKEIVTILKRATIEQLSVMTSALNPYLDSMEKKIEALNDSYQKVNSFVCVINRFLNDKKLLFDVHEGFKIKSIYNENISPFVLSSGERHLLLLFCNSFIVDKSSIMMIDEPEISLNIKWQRKLLSSIIEITGDNPVQYIFATHSIELLSEYKDHVVKFEHIPEA